MHVLIVVLLKVSIYTSTRQPSTHISTPPHLLKLTTNTAALRTPAATTPATIAPRTRPFSSLFSSQSASTNTWTVLLLGLMPLLTYMRYLQAQHQVGALQREIDRLNNAAPHPTAASAGHGRPHHHHQPLLITPDGFVANHPSSNGTCPQRKVKWMASLEPLRLPTAAGDGGAATGDRRRGGGGAAAASQAHWWDWDGDLISATHDTLRLLAAAAVSVPLLVMMYLKAAASFFVHVLVGAGRAICAGAYWLVFWPKLLLMRG